MNADRALGQADHLESQEMHSADHCIARRPSTTGSLNGRAFPRSQQESIISSNVHVDPVSSLLADNRSELQGSQDSQDSQDSPHHVLSQYGQEARKAGSGHVELAWAGGDADKGLRVTSSEIVARSVDRLGSARTLKSLALNIAIVLPSLYFIVFAILAKAHHQIPTAKDTVGGALVDAAQFVSISVRCITPSTTEIN